MRRSSGTQAMPRRASWWGGSPVTSRPSKITRPPDGRTRPITVLSVVLLPTPFRPSRPTTSPRATRSETPWSTCDFP